MNIEFTKHFWDIWEDRKEALTNNGIDPELIKIFATKPDIVIPDKQYENREWRIKKINGRCLKIVVEPKKDRLLIITVFFDRGLKRRNLCE